MNRKEDGAGRQESPDPREQGPLPSQDVDPASGTSDDPRVDPTPDRRHSHPDGGTRDL